MRLKRVNSLLALAALAWSGAGCTTGTLWGDASLVHSHFAGDPPNLAIYRAEQGNDVLVEYNEACDYNSSIVRRAFWLKENQNRILEKQKPHFVSPDTAKNLEEILLELSVQGIQTIKPSASYSADREILTVVFEEAREEQCELPRYADSSSTTKKVLLTPIAVATDATIVGAFVGTHWWAGLGGTGGYSPSK
jgi:hypothetical protein